MYVYTYINLYMYVYMHICIHIYMILTLDICDQHSSVSAASKRRALENYFYERICHIFVTSKCRED